MHYVELNWIGKVLLVLVRDKGGIPRNGKKKGMPQGLIFYQGSVHRCINLNSKWTFWGERDMGNPSYDSFGFYLRRLCMILRILKFSIDFWSFSFCAEKSRTSCLKKGLRVWVSSKKKSWNSFYFSKERIKEAALEDKKDFPCKRYSYLMIK